MYENVCWSRLVEYRIGFNVSRVISSRKPETLYIRNLSDLERLLPSICKVLTVVLIADDLGAIALQCARSPLILPPRRTLAANFTKAESPNISK